ncbi:phasin family protein [Photobacterium swingsii]|uniref:Poly(Hydroxyalkanoate) granule-associated protein n=1 Tax=Photobacterium swingsii TaxID=680026 RepID=A0A0J8VBJ5_9GAMM|nr:phasin family protein [Photobacterium swingsii]KMV30863.1 hypothetical protein AB733_09745 [Photobacterium swingsii]PSW25803.1 hypothetical protein C9I94_04315 [Photobacterium swingsii]
MGIFKRASDESSKTANSPMRDAMVYNIWLAGLGAYAKSADEVNQISSKGKSLFDELIERGREVESTTKERVHTARSQTTVAIEERVHQVVQKLVGLDNERLDQVDDKIDQLTDTIEKLLARQQEAAKKSPAKKVEAKKPAAKAATRKPSVARRKPAKAAEAKPVEPKVVEKPVVDVKPVVAARPVVQATPEKPAAKPVDAQKEAAKPV